MKFKAVSRSELAHTRDRRDDLVKVQRSADPALHPLERAREYTRALKAVKLDKMFAKPLVGHMEGHADGIWCMASSPRSLVAYVTGAADGELRVWDLSHRRGLWSVRAHTGMVRGVSVAHDGDSFYSCSDDKTIKRWRLSPDAILDGAEDDDDDDSDGEGDLFGAFDDPKQQQGAPQSGQGLSVKRKRRLRRVQDGAVTPTATFACSHPLLGVDCHWGDDRLVSCGECVEVWDPTRVEPVHRFSWGADSIRCAKFNPAERDLVAAASSDRAITLYDVRQSTPVRKVILKLQSNALAWNPMRPMSFAVANEDHNVYSFDMRRLSQASLVHKDHVGAVMSVGFSPTGKDIVTGSYDRTVRIFKADAGRSHQMYHNRRMQKVFCAAFTADAAFVVSGSDDTNVRIWKANASKPLGKMLPRERAALEYGGKLVARFQHVEEVRRIHKFQPGPKIIKKQKALKNVMSDAKRRKTQRMLDNAPNSTTVLPEKKRAIVKEFE